MRAAAHNGPFTFSFSGPPTTVTLAANDCLVATNPYGPGTDELPPEFRYVPPFPRDAAGRPRFRGSPDETALTSTPMSAPASTT